MDILNSTIQYVGSVFHTVSAWDVADILLVAFLIYKGIQLVRETRAEQLVKGILLLIVACYLSIVLGLKAMSFIMQNVLQYGVLALIVVFQPEMRSALERLGRSRLGFFNLFNFGERTLEEQEKQNRRAIEAVCEAARTLQKDRIGALILFEMETKLGEIIGTGTVVNADITPELIVNVFYPKAPLHDGAMVLRGGRLYAAGCFLPLSQNQDLDRELGTRHRAALGISENSDTLVVVVSEETGIISLVRHGIIKRNLTPDTLRAALERALLPAKKLPDAKGKSGPGFRHFGRGRHGGREQN